MSATALSDVMIDATALLTVLEGAILRIDAGAKQLGKEKPELKYKLKAARKAVSEAYEQVLKLDLSLGDLQRVIKHEAPTMDVVRDEYSSSSSYEDDEDENDGFVFASQSFKTPTAFRKQPLKTPQRPWKVQKKRGVPGRRLSFGKE